MMSPTSPLAALSPLLGSTTVAVRRLVVASEHGRIVLPTTLVLDVGDRLVVLSYSQQGLRCLPPTTREQLRWDQELEEGEWLELAEPDADAVLPALPLAVERIDGWVGYGQYDDVFAFALGNAGGRLVVTTTSDDLLCTTVEDAQRRAELTAANTGLTLRRETLVGRHHPR